MSAIPASTLADSEKRIADLERQLAECRAERDEALAQQTATAEVLQVINSSPGDVAPVFDAMLDKALNVCSAAFGYMRSCEGEEFHRVASRGFSPALAAALPPPGPTPGSLADRFVQGETITRAVNLGGECLPPRCAGRAGVGCQRFRREVRQGMYTMHFANSGEDALAKLAGGVDPALIAILSDINMPGLYTLKKMLVPEPPSDAQCTVGVPTELASMKWSVIVGPLNNSIVLPFTMLAEVMLPGCRSARSRILVGAPVVLTFILPMTTPFVSKDCRAVAVPRRSVPLSPERKVNLATEPGKESGSIWAAPSKLKVAPAAMSVLLPL
jgi:hypothetical protein